MAFYCGTNIVEVYRIKDAITSTPGFIKKVFSENEISQIEKINSDYKYQRYAGKFAAKEAVYKALSKIFIENNIEFDFLDVEIINDEGLKERPYVKFLRSNISEFLKNKDIEVDVSISHVKDNAIAMAVAEYKKEGI